MFRFLIVRAYILAAGRRLRAWAQGGRCHDRGDRDGTGPDSLIVLTGCEGSMTAAGVPARQPAGESILGLGFGELLGCVSQVKM